MNPRLFLRALLALFLIAITAAGNETTPRKPANDLELRRWLENMIWHHEFSTDEIQAATGLSPAEVKRAIARFGITRDARPSRPANAPLLVLPYPGGRHPRIGFLDGAIDPQRETKLSIFTPWENGGYVVADVPEAIWSNLGLTYLAHTHIPTIWTAQGVSLPPLEWEQLPNGHFRIERTLPNGIRFGTLARPAPEALLLKLWLSNGTSRALSDLRVQNCVMLKATKGFNAQTNANKVLRPPFAACKSDTGDRWIITGWQPIHRAWANAPVPCIHADPQFPDTPPGAVSTVHGLITFYSGREIDAELERLTRAWNDLFSPE